jgi:hypothetical protein
MNGQIANKLIQYMSSTETFLSTQIPDFAQQYLQWCFYSDLIQMFIFVLATILGWAFVIKLLPKIIKNCEKHDSFYSVDGAILMTISCVICAAFTIITLICIPINTMDLIEIKVAPKVYLVENLAKHLK